MASFCERTAAIVCAATHVQMREMFSHTRRHAVARPRQVAMYLAREVKGKALSFPMIGHQFGGLDHTTVMHAVTVVRARAAASPEFASWLAVLVGEVKAMAEVERKTIEHHRITNAMALPLRITTSQVCDLAGYGPQTLNKRITAGTMPKPVDCGKERLFDRGEVLMALGLWKADEPPVASW